MIQKSDPLNLAGKVAVITGAGSGIGLGVAQMLSAYGAAVAIVDVSPKAEAARCRPQRRVLPVRCDERAERDRHGQRHRRQVRPH